ncbi:hypothetical protein KAI54_00235 [Candidatus Gracilibacteria bacterium]|nr:hypothetical protein [Candidatus Gracilibacteria bacterium]
MHHPHPSRFLKTASFVIAFGVLLFGTIFHEKNANLIPKIKPNLNEASIAAVTAENLIPIEIGDCQQNAESDESEKSIFANMGSLDKVITGATVLDLNFWNPLVAAIQEDQIEVKIEESGKEYEFVVKDGQFDFWKCVLTEIPLFSSFSETTMKNKFFSKTAIFESQIEKFDYTIGNVGEVELFLNFAELPAGHRILETTVLAGEKTFFKIFEVELFEGMNYNDLRKDLRDRVGITNLRPAVFGTDSYYWMWGEENRMAASVFSIEGKIFGVSYQTAHFHHIRRVIDSLLKEFKNVNLGSLDNEIVEATESESTENIFTENLSSNILKITPIDALKETESAETMTAEEFDEFTPIEIPKEALENTENLVKNLPIDLDF